MRELTYYLLQSVENAINRKFLRSTLRVFLLPTTRYYKLLHFCSFQKQNSYNGLKINNLTPCSNEVGYLPRPETF